VLLTWRLVALVALVEGVSPDGFDGALKPELDNCTAEAKLDGFVWPVGSFVLPPQATNVPQNIVINANLGMKK